jgi:hypothetical protein
VHAQSIRCVGHGPKPSINGEPCRYFAIALVNDGKLVRKAINACVYARRLGNEGTIDAKPGSAALLTRILLEHIDAYSSSSKTYSRGKSGERPADDSHVTVKRFRHSHPLCPMSSEIPARVDGKRA